MRSTKLCLLPCSTACACRLTKPLLRRGDSIFARWWTKSLPISVQAIRSYRPWFLCTSILRLQYLMLQKLFSCILCSFILVHWRMTGKWAVSSITLPQLRTVIRVLSCGYARQMMLDKERLLDSFILCSLIPGLSGLSEMNSVSSAQAEWWRSRGCPCPFEGYPYKSFLTILLCLADQIYCVVFPLHVGWCNQVSLRFPCF